MEWKGIFVLCGDEEGVVHSLMTPEAIGNFTASRSSCLFPDSSATEFHRDTILILLRRLQYVSPLHQQGECHTKVVSSCRGFRHIILIVKTNASVCGKARSLTSVSERMQGCISMSAGD